VAGPSGTGLVWNIDPALSDATSDLPRDLPNPQTVDGLATSTIEKRVTRSVSRQAHEISISRQATVTLVDSPPAFPSPSKDSTLRTQTCQPQSPSFYDDQQRGLAQSIETDDIVNQPGPYTSRLRSESLNRGSAQTSPSGQLHYEEESNNGRQPTGPSPQSVQEDRQSVNTDGNREPSDDNTFVSSNIL
jgi:hypothetical protein